MPFKRPREESGTGTAAETTGRATSEAENLVGSPPAAQGHRTSPGEAHARLAQAGMGIGALISLLVGKMSQATASVFGRGGSGARVAKQQRWVMWWGIKLQMGDEACY